VGGSAFALSCVDSNISSEYRIAAASEEVYNIFKGRLTFDEAKLDDFREYDANDFNSERHTKTIRINATVDGYVLGQRRFSTGAQVQTSVILEVVCLFDNCGNVSSGSEMILFTRLEGNDRVAHFGACGGESLRLTSETETALLSCHQGRKCKMFYEE
jgi:hypothetical protein